MLHNLASIICILYFSLNESGILRCGTPWRQGRAPLHKEEGSHYEEGKVQQSKAFATWDERQEAGFLIPCTDADLESSLNGDNETGTETQE